MTCSNCGSEAHSSFRCPSSNENLPQAKNDKSKRSPCTFGHEGRPCEACSRNGCKSHFCRKCGAYGHHRSDYCGNFSSSKPSASVARSSTRAPCSLGLGGIPCDACAKKGNSPHNCRNCGAINLHRTNNCPILKSSVASAAKKPYDASHSFLRKICRDGKNITSGNVVVISFTKENGYLELMVHADNVSTRYARGLAMSSGGRIDSGHNAFQTAEKEDMEEQGAKSGLPYEYVGSNNKFHYFVVECSSRDYCGRVTTPDEVMSDPHYIPNRFSNARPTRVPTTWCVPLNDLLNSVNKSNVYGPFRNALFELRNAGVFN
jgi:hypothetical protein